MAGSPHSNNKWMIFSSRATELMLFPQPTCCELVSEYQSDYKSPLQPLATVYPQQACERSSTVPGSAVQLFSYATALFQRREVIFALSLTTSPSIIRTDQYKPPQPRKAAVSRTARQVCAGFLYVPQPAPQGGSGEEGDTSCILRI